MIKKNLEIHLMFTSQTLIDKENEGNYRQDNEVNNAMAVTGIVQTVGKTATKLN